MTTRIEQARQEMTRDPIFLLQRRIGRDKWHTESVWLTRAEAAGQAGLSQEGEEIMPPTDPPIDVTDILAQPREFAQKLARVERERAELIETVARLRAECNDAQAVARAYILRAERAEAEVARLLLLITGHNANAETTCKRWQAEGYCVTAGYDIRCNECPQEWTIDALRQPAQAGGDGE